MKESQLEAGFPAIPKEVTEQAVIPEEQEKHKTQSPVAAIHTGQPEIRLGTLEGGFSLGRKKGRAPAQKVRLYMNFRNMKSCNDKGKWEERKEQSNGELGGCVRLCVRRADSSDTKNC